MVFISSLSLRPVMTPNLGFEYLQVGFTFLRKQRVSLPLPPFPFRFLRALSPPYPTYNLKRLWGLSRNWLSQGL